MDIHRCARAGDLEGLRTLIAEGVNINEPDDYGFPPIYHTVMKNYIDCTRFLLESGANPNINHHNLLYLATVSDYPEQVELLLAHGSNFIRHDGSTPLHHARDPQMLQILLDHISKYNQIQLIDKQDNDGYTALMLMTDFKCIKLLLQYGARYDITTNQGLTLRDIALARSHQAVINILDEVEIDIKEPEGP